MIPRKALIELGKLVAMDLRGGGAGADVATLGQALAAAGSVPDLFDLMAREGRKRKPDDELIESLGVMAALALEVLRYGVERDDPAATEAVAEAREAARSLIQQAKAPVAVLHLILQPFVRARLALGAALEAATGELLTGGAAPALPPKAEVDSGLSEILRDCGGNIFAFQAQAAERTAVFPDGQRAGIVAALLEAPDPALREAAPGWLLDHGPETRRLTASLLLDAAKDGRVSGTMLRRLIALRNWLTDADRAPVDAVIRACRQGGVECAPMPASEVRQVLSSAVDGSGAQSVFLIVKDGRKQAVASVLFKMGAGVRDAWVNPGLSKAELEGFRLQVDEAGVGYEGSPEQVRLCLAHGLAESRESGELPPFGLVDVIERTGLAGVNPEPLPTADLLDRLLGELPAGAEGTRLVTAALAAGAGWHQSEDFADSWFEDGGAVDTLLEGKRLSAKARAALVLDACLTPRRARWAAILAWTALTLRQDRRLGTLWRDLALVARELLGTRPLAEIPLMHGVARMTVEAWAARR